MKCAAKPRSRRLFAATLRRRALCAKVLLPEAELQKIENLMRQLKLEPRRTAGRTRSIEARKRQDSPRQLLELPDGTIVTGRIGIAGCFLCVDTERFLKMLAGIPHEVKLIADGHCTYSDAENRLHAEPKPALAHR